MSQRRRDDFQEKRREFEKLDVFQRYRYDMMTRGKKAFPWKEILLALFLFTVGGILLIIGVGIQTGHVQAEKHWPESHPKSQMYAFIAVGCMMFLPGCYAVFIAVMSLLGYEGYTLDDLVTS
eukprot:CAMPEP_0113871922 /NCGR_PEP_ID=MMETSP0780_2-20120614/2914_1 /TAXON_ID=652834 /ORGANISM="Palpitomonas bilix" /LENGTH=121 /DNA_ID=CAMNT_0000857371 /DNA_START=78 /DNA_END=443 /DNA_ORIENTATION=+ /assembly_acc=CAM_ASM_000599